jgi:uncharacterized lipoprotein
MKRSIVTLALVTLALAGPAATAGEVAGTFAAPPDRVWKVTQAVLDQLGWDVDKADRDIGWITTRSRKVEGEDYGVYAKGTRHRLRIIIKDAGAGKTTVTVERILFKRERILFIDNDEALTTTDRSVEQGILAAISKAL